MLDDGRVTETISASDARERWGELLSKLRRSRTRVILEEDGTPVAAMISFHDLEWLRHLEALREKRFAVLDEIREAFKGVPAEEIEREVAKALAEVRAERASLPTEARSA